MTGTEHHSRIASDPRYIELVRSRGRLTAGLTAVMLVAYFAFLLVIAFDKAALARPIGRGVTSVGIPVGLGLILLSIILTGVYVSRANKRYDVLVEGLEQDHGR